MKDASFKKYSFMATNITGSDFYVSDSLNQCRQNYSRIIVSLIDKVLPTRSPVK